MGTQRKKNRKVPLRALPAVAIAPEGTSITPEPEVVARPARRQFTADYKLRILHEVDATTEVGQVGAILRREGLYSSHITDWRRSREQAARAALVPRKRGRKTDPQASVVAELARTRRALVRSEERLKRAEKIIEIQKKLSELLGIELPTIRQEENDTSSP